MSKRGIFIILVSATLIMALVSCGSSGTNNTPSTGTNSSSTTDAGNSESASIAAVLGEANSTGNVSAEEAAAVSSNSTTAMAEIEQTQAIAMAGGLSSAAAVSIRLDGDSIEVEGDGVDVNGSTATITAGGTYSLRGSLADGQIIVDTEDETPVQLILNGIEITSATSAPIALMNSEGVVIVLADGSANTVTDAQEYTFLDPAEEEPNAAIFSNDDLTITGTGLLTVTGNFNDAISSDDGLVIDSGTISVTAVDDGLRGKDFLVVRGGTIGVNAGGDGLKADNEDDPELGYVAVASGVITVTAGGDAITAETDVLITGGEFNLTSGGGSGGQVAVDASAKGIKGLGTVVIDGGTFAIDATDDALHSNGNIIINGGGYTLASGDDGIHADETITINGGEIQITESYEGIESAIITISAGDIQLVASDDGLNVAGGVDGSGTMPGPGRGRGGPGTMTGSESFTYSGDYYLYIHGGTIVVEAYGDGIDVNGAIEMSGGLVLVNGPTEQMNGALDYDATFTITGGTFVAAGSAGMAQAPSATSTQNSLLVNMSGTLPGGTLINIQNEAGEGVLTFAPSKDFQSIAFSSPDFTDGNYTLSFGGSDTGFVFNGLYSDGAYTPGTEYTSFTVSSVTTSLGSSGFRR